jgi:hypothetical protein
MARKDGAGLQPRTPPHSIDTGQQSSRNLIGVGGEALVRGKRSMFKLQLSFVI